MTALLDASQDKTHKQQLGRENDFQQRRDPPDTRVQCWFPLQDDLAPAIQCVGRNQTTQTLAHCSSTHHLLVWSRIICQTPAVVSSALLGTLVIVLQPAWRMWDFVEGKAIATSFAQSEDFFMQKPLSCAMCPWDKPSKTVLEGKRWGSAGRKGEEKGEEEEVKRRLTMLGKCFCDHTMRFKIGWKWSPPSLAPLPHLLSLKELLGRISRVGF